jgi:hypothetical protein
MSAQANVKCSGVPWKPHFVKTGSEFRITREGWVYRRGSGGVWRPISSHYFWDNNYGAQIVCENLGYGKGVRTRTRNYNNREQYDHSVGKRRCASSNTNILQCRKYGGNNTDMSAQANVKCSGTPWVPRYVRTGSLFRYTSEGWVEIKSGNTWRPISSHYFWDNDYGARIVCENLGYGNGKRTRTRNPHNRRAFDTNVGHRRCAASNTSIFQCRKHGGPNQGDRSA